jgi:hypothetical protein
LAAVALPSCRSLSPAIGPPTQLPHLTLAQVFDALSYYLDHQAAINHYIEQNHIPENLVHPAVRQALNFE